MTWLCKVSHVCCLQSNCENVFVIYAPHPLILKHNLLNRRQLVDAAEAQMLTRSIAKYVFRYGGFRLLAVTNKDRIQLGRSKLPAFDITLFFWFSQKLKLSCLSFLISEFAALICMISAE